MQIAYVKGQEKPRFSPSWIPACFLTATILVLGGWLYRRYQPLWQGTGLAVIQLPVPLAEFPMDLAGWQGQDVPLPTTTEAYMRTNFADDFFSRRYINHEKNAWADAYVVYCSSRPAGILGHRPRICYRGSGWNHSGTESSEVITAEGREVPCLIHRFYRSAPDFREAVVISFYVASGDLVVDEEEFMRTLGRRPNTEGDYTRYVAQVQISSARENHVRAAAIDIIDTIMDFLPDKTGRVQAQPSSHP